MQEHAYPASNEPLIFSRIMVGILDDDVIEVQILYRLYHTGIPIKVLDRDKVVRRAAAFDPRRCAERVPHASRVPRRRTALLSVHCWAGRARHPNNVPPNHAITTYGKNVFSNARDRPYPALLRLANSSHS
jgi:hypothetical protein